MILKQSTSRNVPVLMVESSDHVTGLTGATLTITASKDGAAFASISPTVTELSGGWYSIALTSTHTNTLGALALHITATSADPTDVLHEVVADLPGASVSSVTGAVGSVTGAVGSVTGNVGGSVTSVTGAVGSVTGNVGGNVVGSVASVTAGVTVSTNNDKTGYSLSSAAIQAIWDALTSALTTVGSVGKLLVGNIDAAISSRSSYDGSDTSGTTTLLGRLTSTRAGLLDHLDADVTSRLADADYTAQTGDAYARLGAPAGASISADVAAIKAVLPSALTSGGNLKADALAVNGSTTAATNLAASASAIGRGTVGSAATTTSIPTSALSPAASVADEFAGRTIIFDADTTSTELRGQAATISASTSDGTLTVSALTTAPASGDQFSIL